MKIDVSARLERLAKLTLFDLREEWRRLHQAPPPMRLSRDLLIRGVAYKIQERAIGGPSNALLRKLAPNNDADGDVGRVAIDARALPPPSLKPGVRLVREWRGVSHSVLVVVGGFEWRGQIYPSLSILAREITGAHWSGPRFFGLTARAPAKITRARDSEGNKSRARVQISSRVKSPVAAAAAMTKTASTSADVTRSDPKAASLIGSASSIASTAPAVAIKATPESRSSDKLARMAGLGTSTTEPGDDAP